MSFLSRVAAQQVLLASGVACFTLNYAHASNQSSASAEHNIPTKAQLIETVINAQPVERAHPKYPESAARAGQEGWVQVSFVVNKQGEVIDPIVEDSSGIRSFEKAALRAVKKWQYSPASRNGEPIEQCHTQVQLDFALHKGNGVRRKFAKNYRQVTEAIRQDDMAAAFQAFAQMQGKKLHNRYENAWFWMLDTALAQSLGDNKRMASSAGRAINSSKTLDYLGKENYSNMVLVKISAELALEDYGQAYQTFTLLTERHEKDLPELIAQLTPQGKALQKLIEGNELLVKKGSLARDTSWAHNLQRNNFSLVDVQGELDTVDIRCQNKRSKFTYAEQTTWSIPDSWGQCRVFVTGLPDTTFSLVEGANIQRG